MRVLILVLVLVVVASTGGAAWLSLDFIFRSPSTNSTAIKFDVKQGASFGVIAKGLHSKGLIKDTLMFKALAKIMRSENNIRVGEYALNQSMTPLEVMETISSGKSIQYSLTFQEGVNMYEIAQTIEDKGLGSKTNFLKLCQDKLFIKELLNIDVDSLEGYLFPETYLVTKFTGSKKLIRLMVSNFKESYRAVSASSKISMPRHELVTLSSIIEKETGAAKERPIISSVFHNRLKKSMRLQSDPTIIYGILDQNGGKPVKNISKKDIITKTRYNTYKVAALPHGPIANPGSEAMLAALNPVESEFLYFVSRNNGTHVFSKTYKKHLQAVRKFQLDRKMRKGRSWRDLKE